jgi:hypothetical protein
MSSRFELNVGGITDRFAALGTRVRAWLKNEVAKDSEPFVPFRANNGGTLTRSVRSSIAEPDNRLIYDTVYARPMYKGISRRGRPLTYNRSVHPQASAEWFEKAKAIYKPKWVRGTQAAWRG